MPGEALLEAGPPSPLDQAIGEFEWFADYWADQYAVDDKAVPSETLEALVRSMSAETLFRIGRMVDSLQSEVSDGECYESVIVPDPTTLFVRDGKIYGAVGSVEQYLDALFRLPDEITDQKMSDIEFKKLNPEVDDDEEPDWWNHDELFVEYPESRALEDRTKLPVAMETELFLGRVSNLFWADKTHRTFADAVSPVIGSAVEDELIPLAQMIQEHFGRPIFTDDCTQALLMPDHHEKPGLQDGKLYTCVGDATTLINYLDLEDWSWKLNDSDRLYEELDEVFFDLCREFNIDRDVAREIWNELADEENVRTGGHAKAAWTY